MLWNINYFRMRGLQFLKSIGTHLKRSWWVLVLLILVNGSYAFASNGYGALWWNP